MDLAEVSRSVRTRLWRVPGIVKVPVPEIDIFILRHFLGEVECAALMAMIEANRRPSRLLSTHSDKNFRTSETCNLDPRHEVVRAVEEKLTDFMGIEPSHGEYIQGQRYAVGQQFKSHHDFLRITEPYWPRQEKIGGQRTWTAMIFLNRPEEGGETYFPKIDLKMPPRPGSIVAWNNLDSKGNPNPFTLHQGMPVVVGVKYIVTKWYRERPWGLPA